MVTPNELHDITDNVHDIESSPLKGSGHIQIRDDAASNTSEPTLVNPHKRAWSQNSSEGPFTPNPLQLNEKGRSRSFQTFLNSPKTDIFSPSASWTFEIVSTLVAIGAVGAIMGVLGHFDGSAIPYWPFDITLNALIALLATIANANLAIVIQSGLSQLKWVRFKEGRTPLSDMEAFDEASRGTWGALKLIGQGRGGIFGTFGAVVGIVALALGPFAQQVATYRSKTVVAPVKATIPRALNYTGYLPGNSSSTGFVPILPMKSAIYSGIFAESGKPDASLSFNCPTGNCTWPGFDTLAMCYSCMDMTELMTRYCASGTPSNGNTSACGWSVPNGAKLNSSADVFSMTSQFPSYFGDMPHSTVMRLTFLGTESQAGQAGALAPWAQQCTLSVCVQSLSTNVTNGVQYANITSQVTNNTVVDLSQSGEHNVYITPNANGGAPRETYLLSQGALLGLRAWFSSVFTNGSATRTTSAFDQTVDKDALIVNLTVGISKGETFFDSDIVTAFYWNYYEYTKGDGIAMLMSDLSISMTVAMRSFMGAVPFQGTSWTQESIVHVRWGYISLPLLVVIFTALFLGAAIFRTHRSKAKLWKSSQLAVLFHGLDEETRARLGSEGSLSEKRRRAKDVKVQLDTADSGSLLRE